MDSRKIIYIILATTVIGLAIVHLETIHTQQINRMIQLQSREQEISRELAQQQVKLNSGIYSPEKLLNQIKTLNLEMKPIIDIDVND